MYVRDLEGNEYTCQVTITQPQEKDGNRSLTATILPSKVNKAFIDDIAEMWEIVDHDDVVHKIVYAKRSAIGDLPTVEITAVPIFFDKFDTERIYEEYNEHMAAHRCFSIIFEDSGFNFVLVDSFTAIQWEGLGGGETRLEMFKRGLNRYKAEFRIVGNTVYLEKQIGRDTQFMYRYRLNASNIVQETDATAFYTYAKGYGDYEDGEDGGWESAKLVREYTSPLAQIPQIGIRHAPPIKNGNITTKETMDEQLKTLVDESIKISVSATIHDLRKQGYELAQPELGDRVFLIDERIGLNEEVRVVDMTVTKNWKGEVIDLQLTFGSEGITKRYQSKMQTAINNIDGIISGNIKLPYSVLDDAVLRATEALRSAQTELVFNDNGILAIDKNDPNMVTLFNSAGLGVSRDGGATFENAITGDGINTNLLTAGSINTDQIVIQGGSPSEYAFIQGNEIETRGKHTRTWFGETTTDDVGLQLRYGRLRFHNYDNGRNLYFFDKGISTYLGGSDSEDGGYQGSGTIEFFSHYFDPDVRGLTLYSNRGTIGLKTDTRDVILDADRNSDVRARRGAVFIKPHIDTRTGYNHFRFAVKDNESASDTDGYIVYGSPNTGYASGLRFKKSSVGEPVVWATNGNGDKASGSFYGRYLYGDLKPRGEFSYTIAPRFRVVTNDDKNIYGDIQADRYLTPPDQSSLEGLSSSLSFPPKQGEALSFIRNLDLIRYTKNDYPAYTIPEEVDLSELVFDVIKSIQELSSDVEDLKNGKSA